MPDQNEGSPLHKNLTMNDIRSTKPSSHLTIQQKTMKSFDFSKTPQPVVDIENKSQPVTTIQKILKTNHILQNTVKDNKKTQFQNKKKSHVFDHHLQNVIILDKKLINFETGSEVLNGTKDLIGNQTVPNFQKNIQNYKSTAQNQITITKKPTGISLSTAVSSQRSSNVRNNIHDTGSFHRQNQTGKSLSNNSLTEVVKQPQNTTRAS